MVGCTKSKATWCGQVIIGNEHGHEKSDGGDRAALNTENPFQTSIATSRTVTACALETRIVVAVSNCSCVMYIE